MDSLDSGQKFRPRRVSPTPVMVTSQWRHTRNRFLKNINMIDLYRNYERTDMHNVQKDFWISFTT